jgi:hypothetical protein
MHFVATLAERSVQCSISRCALEDYFWALFASAKPNYSTHIRVGDDESGLWLRDA